MEANVIDIQPVRLRRKDAAAYLGISVRKLEDLSYALEIPFIKSGTSRGAPAYYMVRDLDAWAEAQCQAPESGYLRSPEGGGPRWGVVS